MSASKYMPLEEPEFIRRSVVASMAGARSAHRTAQLLARKGFGPEFVQQARLVRDIDLRAARAGMARYRSAIAKTKEGWA